MAWFDVIHSQNMGVDRSLPGKLKSKTFEKMFIITRLFETEPRYWRELFKILYTGLVFHRSSSHFHGFLKIILLI